MAIVAERPVSSLPRDTILIGGEWRGTASCGVMEHVDPTIGKAQAEFAVGGAREIDEAVTAAKAAFPAWCAVTFDKRREIMLRFAALLRENISRFNAIAALESGAPISFPGIEEFLRPKNVHIPYQR